VEPRRQEHMLRNIPPSLDGWVGVGLEPRRQEHMLRNIPPSLDGVNVWIREEPRRQEHMLETYLHHSTSP
jgi:hypothetical protein